MLVYLILPDTVPVTATILFALRVIFMALSKLSANMLRNLLYEDMMTDTVEFQHSTRKTRVKMGRYNSFIPHDVTFCFIKLIYCV